MKRDKWKFMQKGLIALGITIFCIFSFLAVYPKEARAEESETYFDLLEGAIFDDDSAKRLTYDTTSKTGVVNAAQTAWINRDFSFVRYEKVITPDGEKPFNECTAEFSVTYSDISVLGSQTNILGVQLTSGKYSLAYRVQGKLQYGKSSWLALGNNLDSPFANENQQGNYRIGTSLLTSTTTISVKVTPKNGEKDGLIVFTVNGEQMGTLVYESEEHLTFGLVASQNTAKISNASYKVYGATGWVTPPPPPSYNVFTGEQGNDPFGYVVSTNTGSLTATAMDMNKMFGNIPDFKSVTLTDGTKTAANQVVWEYEATFTSFNYVNGKEKDVPENYYGTGLSLMTSDGVTLNMRIMYDGRLNIASSNSSLYSLGQYGKNFNIYNFCPATDSDDVNKEITLKYVVDRKNKTVAYYVNGVEYGVLTYIGKAELNQFGLHSYYGGGVYKNFALRMIDVASVELPPKYQVFNGKQVNENFSYDGKTNTAHLNADKRNYTTSFGSVPVYKSLTLSDGTKVKSGDAVWEYEATITNLTFGDEPLNYYGIGISVVADNGVSLDMRVMYDGRLYVCAVPAAGAADFGLSASGKIIDIPNFNPKENPADSQKEFKLKYKVNRATGEIGYYLNGSLYGSVTYSGPSYINRYALHSWWGGGDYKDISLCVLDVVDAEVRDYYTEQYVPSNPYDGPQADPNLNIEQTPVNKDKASCSGQLAAEKVSLFLMAVCCLIIIKLRQDERRKIR